MGNSGNDRHSGGRRPVVADREILKAFVDADDPVLSAPEIAECLPISKTGVYKRLVDLDDRGLVASKKFGPGKAWWITDDGRAFFENSK